MTSFDSLLRSLARVWDSPPVLPSPEFVLGEVETVVGDAERVSELEREITELVEWVNSAAFSTVGLTAACAELVRAATNAVQLSTQGSVAGLKAAPVVIGGLPRTGTTLLHNLFSLDSANRVLTGAEAVSPGFAVRQVPTTRLAALARLRGALLAQLAPQAAAAHVIPVGGPEECGVAEMSMFGLHQFRVQCRPLAPPGPSLGDDKTRYRELEHLLARLPQQPDAGRWILKSPSHRDSYQVLFAQWPEADIVEIARPLADVLDSWTELVVNIQKAMCRTADRDEIRNEWSESWSIASKRCADAFRESGRPPTIVEYEWLCREPVSVVRWLYAELGLRWTSDYAERLRLWLRRDPLRAHSSAVASLQHRETLPN